MPEERAVRRILEFVQGRVGVNGRFEDTRCLTGTDREIANTIIADAIEARGNADAAGQPGEARGE